MARDAAELARALDEEAERVALARRLAHQPDRVAVGLAAAHRDRPEGPDQLAEPGRAMRLDLGDVVDRARAGGADERRVDPGEVVEREHDRRP